MTATEHALELTRVAAEAAADKLGTDIVAFDVSEQLAITDVFLVVTATNERQVLHNIAHGRMPAAIVHRDTHAALDDTRCRLRHLVPLSPAHPHVRDRHIGVQRRA